jgi:hypothetical protein
MKKKILLITPRYPFPVLGGDKDRFVGIANTLLKKNKIDIVCISNKFERIITSTRNKGNHFHSKA